MDEQALRQKIGTLVGIAMKKVQRDWDRELAQVGALRKDPGNMLGAALTTKVPTVEEKQAEEAEALALAIEIGVQLVVDFHRIAEALEVVAHAQRQPPS